VDGGLSFCRWETVGRKTEEMQTQKGGKAAQLDKWHSSEIHRDVTSSVVRPGEENVWHHWKH
jgi:hypothetical protein